MYYSIKQIIELNKLPIKETKIREKIKSGELGHYRIDGQLFISDEHIAQFLARSEIKPIDRNAIQNLVKGAIKK